MPELPEAETVRRQLEPQIVGARVVQTWARLPRITQPSVEEFVQTLCGARIVGANRRGKQLYFPLENGSNLLVHLGMTGRLHVEDATSELGADTLHKHIHGVLRFENGRQLVFTDPRTFGALGVARELPFLQAMGPEPIDDDFDEAALARKLATRTVKIKAAILDQKLVAGLGNIYADEVCFLSGVHPATRACDVGPRKLRLLVFAHEAGAGTRHRRARRDLERWRLSGHLRSVRRIHSARLWQHWRAVPQLRGAHRARRARPRQKRAVISFLPALPETSEASCSARAVKVEARLRTSKAMLLISVIEMFSCGI